MNRTTELKRTEFRRVASKELKPAPGPRPKACKQCRAKFVPKNAMARACSPGCAALLVVSERMARERKQDRERKQAMKTRQQWLKEAQAAFNAWVRYVDRDEPCISCGRFHEGAYDAGHYRSVGAQAALRFHPWNCHKQCVPCNQHKGGNVVEYRIRLIAKIGQEAVDWLEAEHEPMKYTIEDAKRIKEAYKQKLKHMKVAARPSVVVEGDMDAEWETLGETA